MTNTPNLGLPEVSASQSQKHVTVNQGLRVLDVKASLPTIKAKDKDLTAPPGSPADGDTYIVGGSPTGGWSGHANDIAYYDTSGWVFYDSQEGWLCYLDDENTIYQFNGASWGVFASALDPDFDTVAIGGATSDSTNRLAVEAPASLFTCVPAGSGGTGDHQMFINKEASGDTASQLFEVGSSGRAEYGLIGDDDFRIKTSPDGSTYKTALKIDKTTAVPQFQQTMQQKSIASGFGGSITEHVQGGVQTTNNTPTVALSIPLAAGEMASVFYIVNGLRDDFTEAFGGRRFVVYRRPSGGNVTIVSTEETVSREDSSGTPASSSAANTTAQTIEVSVTGENSKNINWTIYAIVVRTKTNA